MTDKNADEYLTVSSQPVSSEIKVNDSKFIAHVFHVLNKHQAESVYSNIKRKYHDASHNCFAYRISADEFRYSDDGEPSGTAGLPIYKLLENKELLQTIIIVTRYFGGTKLGTGGLIRAYRDASLDVLNKTKTEVKIRYVTVTVETTYENMSLLLDLVNKYTGIIGKTEYTDKISFCLQIPTTKFEDFNKNILAFSERGIVIIDRDI
ncbi:MAG: YigZ family protein [Calditrichia bacterium]|nr:YigZ family protein [Calditrichia bacterium]